MGGNSTQLLHDIRFVVETSTVADSRCIGGRIRLRQCATEQFEQASSGSCAPDTRLFIKWKMKMNYEAEMATAENIDAACSDAHEHDVASSAEGCTRGAARQRQQRWAWAASGGHYDWMDSHGPFATID
jgi:hypothetical protein